MPSLTPEIRAFLDEPRFGVLATVNPDGSVRKARVVEAKPKGLFEAAAVTAVQKWRFKPKTVDGKAVEFHGVQRIEFNLSAAE